MTADGKLPDLGVFTDIVSMRTLNPGCEGDYWSNALPNGSTRRNELIEERIAASSIPYDYLDDDDDDDDDDAWPDLIAAAMPLWKSLEATGNTDPEAYANEFANVNELPYNDDYVCDVEMNIADFGLDFYLKGEHS